MTKQEKVIRGLTVCSDDIYKCIDCPYYSEYTGNTDCSNHLCADALALLKEREARVMTPYEVRAEYEIVWLDHKDISCEVAILQRIACSMYEFSIMGTDEMLSLLESQYGKTWRCWTSRPSEDRKWEGNSDV